jgi:YD repeat-containing protein
MRPNGRTTSNTYTISSSNNQLASTASGGVTLSYTYDANGARSAIKKGNQTQAAYTYNNDARLATAGTATLKYNAFGEGSARTSPEFPAQEKGFGRQAGLCDRSLRAGYSIFASWKIAVA